MEKQKEPKRELLNELGYEESIVFENPNYDSAIIGVDTDERVVYDYEGMAEHLMKEDKMTYEEAIEFIDYNAVRTLPYTPNGPIVVHPIDDYIEFIPEVVPYKFDAEKEKDKIIEWIREWFEKNGKGCTAVLGLSGGKDSTIVAALCAEALGKDRVIGVAMPDLLQGPNDADKIAEYLGIKYMVMPIGRTCWELEITHQNENFEWSKQSQQNIPPRIRMTMLYAIAQTFNGRVADTCNLSENYIGYCTIFGDCAGAFSPLGNLTVTEVYAIGDALGLPHEWAHKTPDDGLPHSSPDEEKLGFTYETLDKYIREGVEPEAETKEKIDRMHVGSQFKRDIVQIPAYKPTIG
jgi:NAD+ synthase